MIKLMKEEPIDENTLNTTMKLYFNKNLNKI